VRLAVVIPTLNEAERIGPLLDRLGGFDEVVVADGGSTDETPAIAAAQGARVVAAPRGRGPQMNAGARVSRAELLLFLHADTRLPDGAAGLIRAALAHDGVAGGAFRARFEPAGPVLRMAAAFTRFETGLTSFGDQGFFMRRSAWAAAGGFPDQPFLEDVEMRRRLKRLGRFVKLPAAVTTSARRFEAEGALRRLALNAFILLLHRLGAPPRRLQRWYRSGPAHPPQSRTDVRAPSFPGMEAHS